MDSRTTVSALLHEINDQTTVRPYGDGLLVDLPLTYGDGDAVRLLVEPMGSGFRISDRATAVTLLSMAGVNAEATRPADAIADAVRRSGLSGIDAAPGELATYGLAEDLGRLILDVAQASMRVEQLRWLAVRHPPLKYQERVVNRVRNWAASGRQVQRDAPVKLRSGRERQVTLRVSNEEQEAYVQAVSSRDREQAAEHCYYIFDLSEVPRERRIATLDGNPDDWPSGLITELQAVGDVEFYDDPLSLERRLDQVVPPPQPAVHH